MSWFSRKRHSDDPMPQASPSAPDLASFAPPQLEDVSEPAEIGNVSAELVASSAALVIESDDPRVADVDAPQGGEYQLEEMTTPIDDEASRDSSGERVNEAAFDEQPAPRFADLNADPSLSEDSAIETMPMPATEVEPEDVVSTPEMAEEPIRAMALDEDSISGYVDEALAAIAGANSTAELKQARLDHAGDRSPIALANREIGSLAPQERKDAGRRVGVARKRINDAFAARQDEVARAELSQRLIDETVDVTLPVAPYQIGAVHPITAMIDTMCDIFVGMGWEVADGPELEAEWLNFDALNFTPDHPARWTTDTLFVEPTSGHRLMRTHTSPVQARALLDRELPVYVVCPGKVYRADEYDATHLPVFHQIEGLCVDKGITLADLRGTLDHFAKELFGPQVRTRMRPHYFPFTEPSAEVDLLCFVCHGESVGHPDRPCRTCKSEGWIEWGGCGVVNPRVLKAAGVDTDIYSGFAFGMGVDRTVMFRNNAEDLRDFVEGDVRFSRSLKGGAR